jgi:hypothetical protein
MLGHAREAVAADQAWLDERNAKLAEAQAKLNQSFQKLVSE